MFSLIHRATSSSSSHRSKPSDEFFPPPPPPPPSAGLPTSTSISLQPAIDGPPSPEHIRAYTEQMKRGSVITSRTRSYTSSSATSSFRSGSSGTASGSGDNVALSRQSSRRSNASSMPLKNGERPESVQIFGKSLFSRTSRKLKYDHGSRSSSSLSTNPSKVRESSLLTKDHSYEKKKWTRRGTFSQSTSSLDDFMKHRISGPYNFQHLTHTRQEQLPNLERASRMELVSEFSAIRASQAPAHGQLKGIRAEDLHFINFSSEALDASPELDSDQRPRTSHQRTSPRKLTRVKSYDSLHNTPPRPPRSPLTCPCPPPPRTSSRTASMLLGNLDPLATTSLERPAMGTGFRKPKAFHLPISPPRPITRGIKADDFIVQQTISPPKTPDMESWPLASSFESVQLADVPEEEENNVARRRSRMSSASGELRHSKSVPNFSPPKSNMSHTALVNDGRPQTPLSNVPQMDGSPEIGLALSPRRSIIKLSHESWEDDIDYCYQHEAEADCDYEWDRCSSILDTEQANPTNDCFVDTDGKNLKSTINLSSVTDDHLSSHQSGTRRFQQPLVVPSPMDLPELSLMSNTPMDSPELRTPGLLRPSHFRSSSHASSFKESHGFTLSPSLLIPADFSAQMDQDTIYNEYFFNDQDVDPTIHVQSQFEPYPVSPTDGPSGTSSYRSSGFSRASNGATLAKSDSQESVLLSRAANVALQHRSISSSSSLPELIPSSRSNRETRELDLGQRPALSFVNSASAPDFPSSMPLRRINSMGLMASSPMEPVESVLPPVAESCTGMSAVPSLSISGPVHGRKSSAPVKGSNPLESAKGRKRAMSAKSGRTSYMLFPQI